MARGRRCRSRCRATTSDTARGALESLGLGTLQTDTSMGKVSVVRRGHEDSSGRRRRCFARSARIHQHRENLHVADRISLRHPGERVPDAVRALHSASNWRAGHHPPRAAFGQFS